MGFAEKFAAHQIERIRRAIIAYRKDNDIGDPTLAYEILAHLPSSVTYDSVAKNLWRLRNGKPMYVTSFLKACVKFLEVNMETPPEEELGLAMKRFVGSALLRANIWKELQGDYGLRVIGERVPDLSGEFVAAATQPQGFVVRQDPTRPVETIIFVALSIMQGEGLDYGTVNERYYFPIDNSSDDEEGEQTENWRDRKGVCLPVGGQDFLILIRDFMFSHMYVLRREPSGFAGTMILPPPFEVLSAGATPSFGRSQYDVALQHMSLR